MPVDTEIINKIRISVGESLADRRDSDLESGKIPLRLTDEQELARSLIKYQVELYDRELMNSRKGRISNEEEQELTELVFNSLYGLGKIQTYIDDPNVQDIHINGHDVVWLVLRDGTTRQVPPVASSDEELIDIISTAARRLGRTETRFDFASPALNLQLPNGDRLHALMAVSSRPMVSIRSHNFEVADLGRLIELGVLNGKLAHFLSAAVKGRQNIIVAGGTGVGKTTMLRCLINEIPPQERLITIEESLEIGLPYFVDRHPNFGELEARSENIEGRGAIDVAELTREALRMDPGRVMVGEVRGREVLPMLLAMSQGNDGSMCTIHADSSEGVFDRLQMYAAMAEEGLEPHVTNLLVSNAVDLVVHLGWIPDETGRPVRKIQSVREVVGSEGVRVISNEIFVIAGGGFAEPTGVDLRPDTNLKLVEQGFQPESLHAEKLEVPL